LPLIKFPQVVFTSNPSGVTNPIPVITILRFTGMLFRGYKETASNFCPTIK
jgi:hypothetical protein